jgi:preprotein translocase subunit YajC
MDSMQIVAVVAAIGVFMFIVARRRRRTTR